MNDHTRTNVIINIARTLVLTILSFMTFPWVCRYLGSAQVGIYTWCNTFVLYFLVLAKIGIPNLAIRECVKVKDDKAKLSNKAQTFFLIQMVTTVLSFALMCALVFSVKGFKDNNEIIFLLSINFLSGAFSFEWLFIALEKQFYMSVRSIIVLALSTLLIIIFVTNPSDIYIYALITASVTLVTTVINLIYSRKYISFKKTMPYEIKPYIRPLLVLFSITLIISFYNQTDTFILGFIDEGKDEVASYSVGVKGIDVIIGVITALSTVFIPRAAICYAQEDKQYFHRLNKYSMNICLFIVLPAIATMTVLAKPITGLISGNYDFLPEQGYINAPAVLMILSSMMITYSISDMIYGQILLPMKKEKYYLYALLGGTILNVVASIVFGKYVFKSAPAVGVAIGTAVTDLSILVYLLVVTWKWIKKPIFNMNSLKLLIATVLVVMMSFIIKDPIFDFVVYKGASTATAYIVELLSVVIIDAIIYLVVLRLLKEDLVSSFLRRKKSDNA
ncbi:MAG: oligosaccharide flippase family protein [Bacilli bacterium]|nr:oligosaccharide flippase family protein [Bacilli bacterium]